MEYQKTLKINSNYYQREKRVSTEYQWDDYEKIFDYNQNYVNEMLFNIQYFTSVTFHQLLIPLKFNITLHFHHSTWIPRYSQFYNDVEFKY